ncbi:MAG: PaaI family thioesterase [Acidimicrobiales bacterium]
MALRRLHNEDWGFDTNCFVCEPRNAGGLRIPFHHDDERAAVVATFTLDTTFSGAPSYVHGGVSLAVLDEAQAWATIAVGGKLAVTAETSTRFERPVLVDKTYSVVARLTGQDAERITTQAEILDHKDRVCAASTATFVVLGAAQAVRATGAAPDTIDPTLLR